ncbi:MAG: hypothetical protein IOC42_06095 [Methylobacterium sp.]|nr:hypothetical protein [Methylobacterium sp.]MCA3666540.1 hypothetical protein [Methylobacterium sp.]
MLVDIGLVAIGLFLERAGAHAAGIGDGLAAQLHPQFGLVIRTQALEGRALELHHLFLETLLGRGRIGIVLELLAEIVDAGQELGLAVGERRGAVDLLDLLRKRENGVAKPAERLAEPRLRLPRHRHVGAARL